jgi:predicted dehydrogenase
MKQKKFVIGFIGAGGIAHSHIFSLSSLRNYYQDSPEIELESVCSVSAAHRESFAARYGFNKAQDQNDFFSNGKINTVFILGPNKVHYEHLKSAFNNSMLTQVYLEKPVCSTVEEEMKIAEMVRDHPEIKIQVGFQYLFSTNIREALIFWKSGKLGKPVHFDIKYYHGDYLQLSYRSKRTNRLTPAPDGGAMADLGSHAISLLLAFLGDKIQIINAIQAGSFEDVAADSDLFSLINLFDPVTKAAGTIAASRVGSGTGDLISFELYCEKGSMKFSTHNPGYFEYYLEETGEWCRHVTGSDYSPSGSFPSVHVPPGWLRSMVHAHYVFFTGNETKSMIPGIAHGLAVQSIVRQTAGHLSDFRRRTSGLDHAKNPAILL